MKRPLVPVALCYGGGLLLAEFSQPSLPVLFAFAFALLVFALVSPRARLLALWPLIVLIGWTNLISRTATISPHDLRSVTGGSPAIVTVRGRLSETPSLRAFERDEQESFRTLAQARVTSLRHGTNWQPAFGQIVASTPGQLGKDFFVGQTVEITGVLAPPPTPLAEGLFDYRAYLARQGIYYQLKSGSTNDWRLLPPVQSRPPLSDRFLAWAKPALARGLPAEDESLRLEWALTLGWKTALTEDVSEPFIQRRDVPYFRRGWIAHGDHLRNFLHPVPRAAAASRLVRLAADPLDLVLHSADRLAGLGDPRHGDADNHHPRLDLETSE